VGLRQTEREIVKHRHKHTHMQTYLEKEDLKVAVFLVLKHDGVRSDKSRGVNKLSYTVRVDRRDVWTTSYPTFPRHTDTHHLYTRHTLSHLPNLP